MMIQIISLDPLNVNGERKIINAISALNIQKINNLFCNEINTYLGIGTENIQNNFLNCSS